MILAKEPDFRLGFLAVSPSAGEIRPDGGPAQRIEPKVMEVLVVLARAGGQTVTRDELVDACWGGRVVSDDAINRTIAKVRLLARELDPPPFTLDTVPKIGFRLVAGESAAHARKSPDPLPAPTREPAPGWANGSVGLLVRRHWGVLVATVVVVAGLAVWAAARLAGPTAVASRGSVNVVLLQADPNDPALAPMSLRIGEAAVHYLTQAGIPTQQTPLTPELAAAAKADLRIAGTLHRVGDTHVINGQVIDRASGVVLWSGKLERPVQIPGLDERFGSEVAAVLKCALDESRAAGRVLPPELLALFFNTCDAGLRGSVEVATAGRRLAAAAPDIAGAHGFHAIGTAFAASGSDNPEEIAALIQEAEAATKRAFAIDPRTPLAHLAVAETLGQFANWSERERHIDAALESRRDMAIALAFRTILLREVGRLRDAAAMANRSVRLGDPRSLGNLPNVAFLNAMTGDQRGLDEAERLLDGTSVELAASVRWTVAVWWLEPEAALRELPGLRRGAGSDKGAECVEFYLRRLVETKTRPIIGLPEVCNAFSVDWRIRFLARQGDVEEAYRLLGRPLPNSRRSTMFLFYPEMKAFRQDPRFMPMMQTIGLLDYWRQSGNWPDFCEEPDLPYDCRTWRS